MIRRTTLIAPDPDQKWGDWIMVVRRHFGVLGLVLLLASFALAQGAGEEYLIGSGDVLQLNVLQQPDLDRELQVRPDGTFIVPMVGEIDVAGLTITAAEQLLIQKIRLFDRDIRDISLTVVQYNALRVYVLGAVMRAGNFTFSAEPSLWAVLREAGGLAPTANPAAIRVVSVLDGTTTSSVYDISAFIAGTGPPPSIKLKTGDTVIVPGAEDDLITPESGVQVFGGVFDPGVYPIIEPTPLMSVLMLAGAPSDAGELRKVWWVHQREDGNYVSSLIDVKLFLEMGDLTGNPLIYPGDTIHMERQRPGFWRGTFPILLGLVTSIATVALAYDRISN